MSQVKISYKKIVSFAGIGLVACALLFFAGASTAQAANSTLQGNLPNTFGDGVNIYAYNAAQDSGCDGIADGGEVFYNSTLWGTIQGNLDTTYANTDTDYTLTVTESSIVGADLYVYFCDNSNNVIDIYNVVDFAASQTRNISLGKISNGTSSAHNDLDNYYVAICTVAGGTQYNNTAKQVNAANNQYVQYYAFQQAADDGSGSPPSTITAAFDSTADNCTYANTTTTKKTGYLIDVTSASDNYGIVIAFNPDTKVTGDAIAAADLAAAVFTIYNDAGTAETLTDDTSAGMGFEINAGNPNGDAADDDFIIYYDGAKVANDIHVKIVTASNGTTHWLSIDEADFTGAGAYDILVDLNDTGDGVPSDINDIQTTCDVASVGAPDDLAIFKTVALHDTYLYDIYMPACSNSETVLFKKSGTTVFSKSAVNLTASATIDVAKISGESHDGIEDNGSADNIEVFTGVDCTTEVSSTDVQPAASAGDDYGVYFEDTDATVYMKISKDTATYTTCGNSVAAATFDTNQTATVDLTVVVTGTVHTAITRAAVDDTDAGSDATNASTCTAYSNVAAGGVYYLYSSASADLIAELDAISNVFFTIGASGTELVEKTYDLSSAGSTTVNVARFAGATANVNTGLKTGGDVGVSNLVVYDAANPATAMSSETVNMEADYNQYFIMPSGLAVNIEVQKASDSSKQFYVYNTTVAAGTSYTFEPNVKAEATVLSDVLAFEVQQGDLDGYLMRDKTSTTETAPGAPTVAINVTAGILNGTYSYKITFVTADGETEGGTTSANISPVNQQVDLSNIPIGTSRVTARKIYRTVAGGTQHKYVATISDNATTTYTDNIADGSLSTDVPTSNTTGPYFTIYVDKTEELADSAYDYRAYTDDTFTTKVLDRSGKDVSAVATWGVNKLTGSLYADLQNTAANDNVQVYSGADCAATLLSSEDCIAAAGTTYNQYYERDGANNIMIKITDNDSSNDYVTCYNFETNEPVAGNSTTADLTVKVSGNLGSGLTAVYFDNDGTSADWEGTQAVVTATTPDSYKVYLPAGKGVDWDVKFVSAGGTELIRTTKDYNVAGSYTLNVGKVSGSSKDALTTLVVYSSATCATAVSSETEDPTTTYTQYFEGTTGTPYYVGVGDGTYTTCGTTDIAIANQEAANINFDEKISGRVPLTTATTKDVLSVLITATGASPRTYWSNTVTGATTDYAAYIDGTISTSTAFKDTVGGGGNTLLTVTKDATSDKVINVSAANGNAHANIQGAGDRVNAVCANPATSNTTCPIGGQYSTVPVQPGATYEIFFEEQGVPGDYYLEVLDNDTENYYSWNKFNTAGTAGSYVNVELDGKLSGTVREAYDVTKGIPLVLVGMYTNDGAWPANEVARTYSYGAAGEQAAPAGNYRMYGDLAVVYDAQASKNGYVTNVDAALLALDWTKNWDMVSGVKIVVREYNGNVLVTGATVTLYNCTGATPATCNTAAARNDCTNPVGDCIRAGDGTAGNGLNGEYYFAGIPAAERFMIKIVKADFDTIVDPDPVTDDGNSYVISAAVVEPNNTRGSDTFYLMQPAPDAPNLQSPADGAYVSDTTPTLTWVDLGGDETAYQVQVDDSADFGSLIDTTTTADGATVTWDVTVALTEGVTHYWRVRAYDGSNWGSWSVVRTFIVDATGPTAQTYSPTGQAHGAVTTINVSPKVQAKVTFDEALKSSTVTSANVFIEKQSDGVDVAATVTLVDGDLAVLITPNNELAFNTEYCYRVGAGLHDVAGNGATPVAANTICFTTTVTGAPTVDTITVAGADATTGVITTTDDTPEIIITLQDGATGGFIAEGSIEKDNILSFTINGDSIAVTDAMVLVSNNAGAMDKLVLTYTPAALTNLSYHTVGLLAKDAQGYEVATNFAFYVSTDVAGPTADAMYPADDATGIASSVQPIVTFSEALDPTTVTSANIILKTYAEVAVNSTVVLAEGDEKVVIVPNEYLTAGAQYYISVTAGVKDVAGNTLTNAATWNDASKATHEFTVAEANSPTFTAVTPVGGSGTADTTPTIVIVATDGAAGAFDAVTTLNNIVSFTIDGITPSAAGTVQPALAAGNVVITSVGGTNNILTLTYTPTTALSDNTYHTISIDVRDAEGNTASMSFVFYIVTDTTAPTVTSVSPVTVQYNGAVANLVMVFTDDTAFADAGNDDDVKGEADIINVVLDGTNIGASANFTALLSVGDTVLTLTYSDANLAVGVHSMYAKVQDASGNWVDNSFTVVVEAPDIVAPVANLSLTDVTTTTVTVTISVDENANYYLEIDDSPTFGSLNGTHACKITDAGWTGPVAAGPFTCAVTALTANTIYYSRAVVKDAVPNQANSLIYVFRTNEYGAPTLTNVTVAGVDSDQATISWTVTPASGGVATANDILYSKNSTMLTPTTVNLAGGNTPTNAFPAATFDVGTTYYFQVRSTADAKTTTSPIYQFTTAFADTGIFVGGAYPMKTYATADNTYANGWKWAIDITVNNVAETNLKMQFDNWVNGANNAITIAIANNMRIGLVNLAAGANNAAVEAATEGVGNAYATQVNPLVLVDENPNTGGIQETIYLYMKIPAAATPGAYSTQYGIQTY